MGTDAPTTVFEFLLDLSTGFAYDVLRDRTKQLDMSEHRRRVLEHFSDTLCLDELHLGRFSPCFWRPSH